MSNYYTSRQLPETIIHAAVAGSWQNVLAEVARDPSLVRGVFDCQAQAFQSSGMTLLHLAAATTATGDVVQALLDQGADVNAADTSGRTPVYIAAGFNPHLPPLEMLVQRGADIQIPNRHGITPLHAAAVKNSNAIVIRFLLQRGADPYLKGGPENQPPWMLTKDPAKLAAFRKAGVKMGGGWRTGCLCVFLVFIILSCFKGTMRYLQEQSSPGQYAPTPVWRSSEPVQRSSEPVPFPEDRTPWGMEGNTEE